MAVSSQRFRHSWMFLAISMVAIFPAWAVAQSTQPTGTTDASPASAPAAEQAGPVEPAPAAATQPAEDPVEAWIQATKHPVPWMTWGADLRLRDLYINNGVRLNKKDPTHEIHRQRYRPRWWTTISPSEHLDFNMRMVWEANTYAKPHSYETVDRGEVLFDIFNFKLKKPFDLPITITGGRQEISLGDRWLVFEGGPLDGSRTICFDAIRLTADLEDVKTRIDLIYIDQDAEGKGWIPMLKDRHTNQFTGVSEQRYITEQDERGAVLWIHNESIARTELDGYFIYKNTTANAPSAPQRGDDADIYTFGGRAAHAFDEHWKARAELAHQFGHKNDSRHEALGFNSQLAYHFNDRYKNWLRLEYEYLSGDRPGSGTNEAFDMLWGRWPRWSELYIYTNAGETGRFADSSNLHRIGTGWSCQPHPRIQLATDYHVLFADQNTYRDRAAYSRGGKFRGQLLTWSMKYIVIPNHLTGHLWAEFFCPGDYWAKSNNDFATFLRAELIWTW